MQRTSFRQNPLAAGVAMALGVSATAPASAQGDEVIEEIVTVGIRSSLTSSANLKRGAQGVVDGIVAEDIGKFPDTNLAESMQRIAGVSIDRSAIGEGQQVTVRGVGPDFNLVLLNGRQMPTASLEDTTSSDSRAFDFANLASEAVSAIEIYKTSRANIPTGGIGATVNIRTSRPFDIGDTVANIGVKAVHDESTDDGDSVTPEISGIFSTITDDERFGVAVTASYQKRDLGYNQAAIANGWRPFTGDESDWGTIPLPGDPGSENITNRPDATDLYSVPQNIVYSFNEVQRERTNGQLTFQYRPIEAVTGTLDYTYSENTLDTQRSELSSWFNFGDSVSNWTDGPVAAPLVYTETIPGENSDLCSGGADYGTKNENKSLGFNLVWDVSDRLGLALDYHDSSAESGENSPYGSNAVIGACGFFRGDTTGDFSGEFPVLSVDTPITDFNVDGRGAFLQTGRSFRNSYSKMDIDQTTLSGDFVFADDSSLDFGVQYTDMDNRSAFSNVQTDSWGGYGTPADYPDEVWGEVRSTAGKFDNMPGDLSNIFPFYFDWDFGAVRAAGIQNVAGGDATSFSSSGDYTTDRLTNEETISAYVQYNRDFDLGAMPATVSVGLRYEDTDVTSDALVPEATGILWVAANEFSVQFGDPVFTSLDGSYDYVLPSLDFSVDVRDDMIVRASYSETLGRPGWNDIQGGQTINQLIRIDGGTGNQGDPGLKPLESTNIDLSFEWYYNDASYISVSYFDKDIDNYVGITSIELTPFDLPHPAQGARYDEAVAAVGDDLNDIRNYIFANYADTPEVTVTGTDVNGNTTGTIAGIAGQDPASTFDISVPANQQSAELDGWELSMQHMFGETGFGFSANYTWVDSDLGYDNGSKEDQFAIEGLSDSANFIGFWENDDWSIRAAYNWRDEFLSDRTDPSGLSNPVYTDSYGQWDMNVNYNVNESLTVFAEGINLRDDIQRLRGRADNQSLFVTQTGRRYMFGARYNFR